MKVLIRPEALAEVREACRWYDERVPGLGSEFARAVDAAIASAAREPTRYRRVESDLRRVLLRKFPYAIFYGVEADAIVIVACFHHRRDPRRLAQRRSNK